MRRCLGREPNPPFPILGSPENLPYGGWGRVMLAGCASIPERELENAFKYQRLKRNDQEFVQSIKSEYQTLASTAWKNMEAGRTGQYVGILELGDDALLARIHLIRAARSTIDVQIFIWKDDPTGCFVFDELVKAAGRGVLVPIDALNMPAPSTMLNQPVSAGWMSS